MYPWERRLKDLAHTLHNCEQTYFDPELFRMNTNQFLQTSRTVTFIIQKNKATIPSFENWYSDHVLNPWAADGIMSWAKDSRNKIEKEGDLDLHSTLAVTLIFSYFEEQDISLPCGHGELVRANVKRLIRFARREFPSGVSDSAVVSIERRWVANSLPNWELATALKYIYARIREVCVSLAEHLQSKLDDNVPQVTQFDTVITDSRKTRYIKLNGEQVSRFATAPIQRVPGYVPTPELVAISESWKSKPSATSLNENVQHFASIAKLTFEQFGNHVPMIFMFDENWQVIDYHLVHLDDQATKFLFWRLMAERLLYIKPHSLIWICEAWLRKATDLTTIPTRNLPITGEVLHIVGIDQNSNMNKVTWTIHRDNAESKPWLESDKEKDDHFDIEEANFLVPIRKAFEKLRN